MSYTPMTIEKAISKLNKQIYLPAIQREFVWQPEKIITLVDSILRRYPINTFLFWELKEKDYDRWEIYEFIKDFDPRSPHNKIRPSKSGIQDLTLVLDGQQRLTSLYIAFEGSYVIRPKGSRRANPDSWKTQMLHIDLFKDAQTPVLEDQGLETEVHYHLKFFERNAVPQINQHEYWFHIAKILKYDDSDEDHEFDRYVADEKKEIGDLYGDGVSSVYETNIRRLYETVHRDPAITYFPERRGNLDLVLDIFARTNMGGVKLTKSDLLLSMVTAKWEHINAREDIHTFVGEINTKLGREHNFDKDFVLKTALVLTDLPVAYSIEHFSKDNLKIIQGQWNDIKEAIRKTVRLVNAFGLDNKTLTSANALIPIIYFIFKNPKANLLAGSTHADTLNRQLIQKWLIMVLMNKVFSGQSDNMLSNTRTVLVEHGLKGNFPVERLNARIVSMGRIAGFSEENTLKEILDIEYNDTEDFLALSLLYDEKSWSTVNFQKDHIFPQDSFDEKNLKRIGYEGDQIAYLQSLRNRLGNLQLILDSENAGKRDKPIDIWLETRGHDFRKKHLIPDDNSLLKLERFGDFLKEREALIRERLKSLFNTDNML